MPALKWGNVAAFRDDNEAGDTGAHSQAAGDVFPTGVLNQGGVNHSSTRDLDEDSSNSQAISDDQNFQGVSATEAVGGIPNIVVSQEEEDVVSQSQEEEEAALLQPPKKKARHLPPAPQPVSSSPPAATREISLQCREDRRRDPRPPKAALLRSTAKARQQLPAPLEQPVSSSPPAATWEIPLLCREDRCRERKPPIFEDVTYEVDGAPSESDSSNGACVIIRWMCHHCGTTSSQRVRP